jgi:hypothetical protein
MSGSGGRPYRRRSRRSCRRAHLPAVAAGPAGQCSRLRSRRRRTWLRVITGDIEHIYGPGGEVWDDDALRARNERAERERNIENIRRQAKRRQDETDAVSAITTRVRSGGL